ncbi:MAG TPA: ABC transporter permease [Candidatus Binatia bacterium]|nr:ABC transporter permease [Candidatus Binatia bacterium]
MLLALATTAVCAPLLAPASPTSQSLDEGLRPPSAAHVFGQDKLGRDQLSRVIYGARPSLLVGVVTVGVSALVGLLIGAVAGYRGGWIDLGVMRVVDVLLAFPGLLLAIAVSAVLGPGLRHVVLALCVIGWTGYARVVRAEVLSLRTREFVESARALGASPVRVLRRHVMAHVLPLLAVQASFGMAGAVVAEAGLSFLGLGIQPPAPSWGAMLNDARTFLLIAPHLAIFPGAALMLTVLGLNLLGEGLRDALDVHANE